jgi:hypothetical protein
MERSIAGALDHALRFAPGTSWEDAAAHTDGAVVIHAELLRELRGHTRFIAIAM